MNNQTRLLYQARQMVLKVTSDARKAVQKIRSISGSGPLVSYWCICLIALCLVLVLHVQKALCGIACKINRLGTLNN